VCDSARARDDFHSVECIFGCAIGIALACDDDLDDGKTLHSPISTGTGSL
jgi:hypothetical protein